MDSRIAIEALLRELRGLRPGLDRPHDHRGVQREKVDNAIQMGELALSSLSPVVGQGPYINGDSIEMMANELMRGINEIEAGNQAIAAALLRVLRMRMMKAAGQASQHQPK